MDHRPIGIFDSGLGGLTAVIALRKLLPDENIIYFGDTARMPYGTKSVSALRKIAGQDLELVAEYGVKAIIAACGTVSSTAPETLAGFRIPVFNVVDSPVKKIADTHDDAPIGIIATEASIRSGFFADRLSAVCPGRKIIALPCQDFVRLIESGHTDSSDQAVRECVRDSLLPLKISGVSSLLLGCTHFGFLSETISEYMGANVELISASECAAESVCSYLMKNSLSGGSGEISFITSGDRELFIRLSSRLLGYDTAPYTVHIETPDETAEGNEAP